MNLPKYPEDFFDFGKGVNVSDEEINKWIEKLIEELDSDTECYSVARSTGNTYVRVDKDDCAKYIVFVTKNYQVKSIY